MSFSLWLSHTLCSVYTLGKSESSVLIHCKEEGNLFEDLCFSFKFYVNTTFYSKISWVLLDPKNNSFYQNCDSRKVIPIPLWLQTPACPLEHTPPEEKREGLDELLTSIQSRRVFQFTHKGSNSLSVMMVESSCFVTGRGNEKCKPCLCFQGMESGK